MRSDSIIYLSVILSTYNDEKYISDCITSILNQTYPYFELIIVNDGSTDSTLEIIKSFKDERIVLVDKPNSGLPDSLNKGISISKYDWIARMDGDDVAEPDRFEKQIQYLNDSVDIIGGQYKTIDSDGNYTTGEISRKPLSNFVCKCWLFFGMAPIVHPTAIIRKSLLDKYGQYDINFKAAQDLELWSRLAPTARMINCKDVVLKSRSHTSSITSSRSGLQRDLAFLGYLKYVLRIRQTLTDTQFDRLCSTFGDYVEKNKIFYDKSHNHSNRIRFIYIVFYYIWRVMLLLRLRISSNKLKEKVLGV